MSATTTTTTQPAANAAPNQEEAFHPVDVLLHVIATFLAPMFLTASGGNIGFARMAALETVNAYRVHSPADLIPIAQVIAFGLAALGSLSLSMGDGLSLAMTLRLRGNANACDRSAERNRRALRDRPSVPVAPLHAVPDPAPDNLLFEAELVARVAATQRRGQAIQARMQGGAPGTSQPAAAPVPPAVAPQPPAQPAATASVAPVPVAPPTPAPKPAAAAAAPMTTDRQRQMMWGAAMADVAAEYTAELANLSPMDRREAMLRANALTACADLLLSGGAPPRPGPGDPAGFMPPNAR